MDCRIGTAGWQVTAGAQAAFAREGTHLQRYAARMNAAEINTSFYRPHAEATYAKWREQTPPGFRFSVKLPRAITHRARLADAGGSLQVFLQPLAGLGDRLGCLLVQLPPSLACDAARAGRFLTTLRALFEGAVALEPRHASWFTPQADALLVHHRIARVLADPVLHAGGEAPGGWPGLIYLRLHGAPRVYYSAYDPAWLPRLAARIAAARGQTQALWCIFDNTAAGHALGDALALEKMLGDSP